jgi:hypothetical protein
MTTELIVDLPKFDTGQYEGCEFIMSGRDAKLTVRFSELPSFGITFFRIRWHQFTALPNCSEEMTKNAYFRLVELNDSKPLATFLDADKSPRKPYKELHHYKIFLDGTGCHEVFAESASTFNVVEPLSLDDASRWSRLRHAYGAASNIPDLLRQLAYLPTSRDTDEPWFSLSSALAHQGDIYSASFAAVPHVISALSIAPSKADSSFFQFPAWVEICRQKKSVPVPDDLREAYFAALARLPSLVAAASDREWDDSFLAVALSAIASAKGHGATAEAVQELSADVAKKFMEWWFTR